MSATRLTRPAEHGGSAGDGASAREPVVVIAGRPNVGKSTLVNRIVGRRVAIVEEKPGVTRDRLELRADWRGRSFVIIDTGGVLERGDALDKKVTAQALRAVASADVVLFVLDATTGLTAEDEAVASMLRRRSDKVLVVANKVDSLRQEAGAWELARLGFGDPVLVSALHGRSVGDLLDLVVERLASAGPSPDEEGGVLAEGEGAPGRAAAEELVGGIHVGEGTELAGVAIVGRPNVGKSTLFNRLVGDERSVVHDVAGTTRDAIDTLVETDEGLLRFIDTAGLRRKSRIEEGSEYYSLVRSLSAIDRADVALLVIDAAEGVTHQEQRLAERVDAAGSPIVIVLNKWDLLDTEHRLSVARDVEDRLGFLDYAPILRISATSGSGVHRLLPAVRAAIDAYHRRIPTGQLNEAMKAIQSAHPAPGARILYAVQGAVDPPTITVFATSRLQPGYLRYVERGLRERFGLGPTPLKLRVRLRGKS
ncbi:MAG TPA: ribosome biogenesis GTPase Der [Acidimicrobiales bacterium]|nr:ribosome biogenesis GTPase Der [Acidimicrobiales bacterium]